METLAPGRRRVLRVPHVRATNRAAILQLLRRHRTLSRAEIARRTGLSEAAISRIVAQLIASEIVVEEGGEDATGGRPAIRLQLNETRFQAFGVDILNWETRISLGTISGRILESHRFRTPPTPEKTLNLIAEQLERLGPRPVGVSARGLINSETGVVILGSDPAWINVAVKQYLEERLHQPVYVDNDVRIAALAEYHYGAPDIQGCHCVLVLMVSEGVGGAIILDGRLYRGPRMAAGEFGEMRISEAAEPELHPRPGTLESLTFDSATVRRYAQLSGGKLKPNSANASEQVKRICHLALQGDAAARRAVEQTGRYLGIGIANAVWALDAEAVVIDGPITEAWPLLAAAIREQFPEDVVTFRNLMLRPSSLGGEAAIVGAATLPFSSLFSAGEIPRSC